MDHKSLLATQEGLPDVLLDDVVLIRTALAGNDAACAAFARVLNFYQIYRLINHDRLVDFEPKLLAGVRESVLATVTQSVALLMDDIRVIRAWVNEGWPRDHIDRHIRDRLSEIMYTLNEAVKGGARTGHTLTQRLDKIDGILQQAQINDASMTYLKSAHVKIERLEQRTTPCFPPHPDEIWRDDDIPLDEMELSVRSYNCLRHEVKTLNELCRRTERELLRIPNFGKVSLRQVKEMLQANYGRTLKEETIA